MKRLLGTCGMVCLALAGCAGGSAESAADGAPPEFEQAVGRVYPALVRIHVVAVMHSEGRAKKAEGAGSGVIISPEGHVVTNHHVAGDAKWFRCTLPSKEEVEAELVGTDALSDIAVIKLKPVAGKYPPYPAARFGDSDALNVSDRVLAMGSPAALSQSVTLGIVSNTQMVMPELYWGWMDFKLDGEDVGSIVRWIAHDAAIYPGNSGGPLVNLAGEIVGINEIGMGLGGAIPGNLARLVAEQLIRDGKVARSWIGVAARPLFRSMRGEKGVLVNGVVKGSPGEKAGLKPGDRIVAYDGKPVSVRWMEELPGFNRLVFETPVGKTVKVQYFRGGHRREIELQTVDLETVLRRNIRAVTEELSSWGLTARDISPLEALELRRERTEGVLVTSTRAGGPCDEAKPPIWARDVLVKVGNTPIRSLADLKKATQEATRGRDEPTPVLVSFERKEKNYLTVAKIGPVREPRQPIEARKAWFPGEVQVLTRDLAESLGLKGRKGVRVTQLHRGALPKGADLKVGDLITAIDGDEIDATNPEDHEVFPNMIRQRAVNAEIPFSVIRDGQEKQVAVTLPAAPVPASQMAKHRDEILEFSFRDTSIQDKLEEGVADRQGVLVTDVAAGGTAALGHLAVGDLLLEIQGSPAPNVARAKETLAELAKAKPASVILFVQRGIHTHYLEANPEWPLLRSPGD